MKRIRPRELDPGAARGASGAGGWRLAESGPEVTAHKSADEGPAMCGNVLQSAQLAGLFQGVY